MHRHEDVVVFRNAIPHHPRIRTVHSLRIIHVATVFKSRAGRQGQCCQREENEGKFHVRQLTADPGQMSIAERRTLLRDQGSFI